MIGDANAQLFDTLFVFHSATGGASETNQLMTSYDIGVSVAPTEYATNFEVEQRKDDVVVRIASSAGSKTQERLQKWLEDFEQAFQDILHHPERSALAFPSQLQSLPLAIKIKKKQEAQHDDISAGEDLNTIHSVLADVSGMPIKEISLQASIFSLGLDSIAAINVAAACRKQGLSVSVADVLQGQSLQGICQRLRGKRPENSANMDTRKQTVKAESRAKAIAMAGVGEESVEYVLPCLAGQAYHLRFGKSPVE